MGGNFTRPQSIPPNHFFSARSERESMDRETTTTRQQQAWFYLPCLLAVEIDWSHGSDVSQRMAAGSLTGRNYAGCVHAVT